MALTKEQKQKVIKDLQKSILEQKSMVFVDFNKVNSKDIFTFRKELKAAGSNIKISKKTLLGIAFGEKGSAIWKQIKENVPGQLAVIFGMKDELSPAKITANFTKKAESLKILGGTFENNFISIERVMELSRIPSREELLAKLVGSICNPITGFARVLDKIRESREKVIA